jgi:regulator of cell morphogenesis and NO signaling
MHTNPHRSVREFAIRIPGAIRVLESVGIDYACSGGRSLAEACDASGVDVDVMTATLERLEEGGAKAGFMTAVPFDKLTELIGYIVDVHHAYTRREFERIGLLLEEVGEREGDVYPQLLDVQVLFEQLRADLLPHMDAEEETLFPRIMAMEWAESCDKQVRAVPPVVNPVRRMNGDHDSHVDLLRQIRRVTNGYAPPPGASTKLLALYLALERLEENLHEHIHYENNVLFPRAVALEDAATETLVES